MIYMTDGWRSYEKTLTGKLNVVSKRYAQRIERHNLNLRQHLARLTRKTLLEVGDGFFFDGCWNFSYNTHYLFLLFYFKLYDHIWKCYLKETTAFGTKPTI
ncbi:transposase [Xenorhabdus thuongxuanensis]|uniref:Transposase n=1 Tax=Xenorhabdus thuongxuanensis TaxID=1873484 RepID=A0A1Q5U296_9GAMM|nr:transposase [Xenorhabdus thuongxuanensis]